jgi:SAM-dependent methyltransferase
VKPSDYYHGCNPFLLRAVPAGARHILDVGCGAGRLGSALKQQDPARQVYGIEREPAVAAQAAAHLDQVFTLDLEQEDPPLPPGSLDCILYGDVLEHLVDPGEVLRRHRPLLSSGGCMLASVPNVQHYSLLVALLTSDWQYTRAGLLDATHLRFFTYSTLFKLFLDAGLAPTLLDTISLPCSAALLTAAEPLLRYLGLHPGRTGRYLGAYQYILRGTPLPDADTFSPADDVPLSFVACVSDEATVQANLLSSPCLGPGTPHEVLLQRGCRSAADGLNAGLARARHDLVVCLHQDVYLPRDWPRRFARQYRRAEQQFGTLGVAGIYGVHGAATVARRVGRVVDRDRLLWETPPLPAVVDTLDELLLAVPRGSGLRFDARLGFHFYGADLCLAGRQRGLAAVALDALCFHHSRGVGLPEAFFASGSVFAAKWRQALPLATPCVQIDSNGQLRPW